MGYMFGVLPKSQSRFPFPGSVEGLLLVGNVEGIVLKGNKLWPQQLGGDARRIMILP